MVKVFTRPNFFIFIIAFFVLFTNFAHGKNSISNKKTNTVIGSVTSTTVPAITFNTDLGSKPYGTADFIPATSTSTATITFGSSNTAVATIVNGKVHITGLGSTTISVSQDANAQFDASSVTATLIVIQATPQISFVNNLSPKLYTTTDFTAATATFGAPITYTTDNSAIASIINNRIHLVSTGTVNITATIPTSAQYVGTSLSIALTIQKSTPAVTFISGLNAKAFTSLDFTPATILPAVPVIYTSDNQSVATIINNNVHMVGTGTANITATITGNDLYNGAVQNTGLTVVPSSPVITFSDLSAKQYTSTDFLPATVTPTVPVIYTSDNTAVASIINNNVHLVSTGSANITATITGTALYSGTTQTTALNVIKATPVISFISSLNNTPFSITDFAPATIAPVVPVIYTSDNQAVATIINNNVHLAGLGTANITATIAPSAIYNGATQTAALNVVQASPVISFIAGLNAKAFTTTDFVAATTSPVVPIIFTSSDPTVATIINNNVHLVGTGAATITATITGTASYSAATASTTLNVIKATPVISFIAGLNNKAFSIADFVAATATPTAPIIFTSDNPAVATIINNNVHLIGAGTVNITATITGTSLYNGAVQTTALTVTSSTPVISFIAGLNAKPFTSADFVAATSNPAVPIIFTSDNPAVATIINNNVHLIGVGTANITATIAGTSSYSGVTQTTTLNVVKATPVISFIAGLNNKAFSTSDFIAATSNPAVPIIFTSGNPAVATIINNNIHLIGVGTTNITATITGTSSYSGVTQTTTLNVVQAAPVISFIAGLNAKPFTSADFVAATSNPAVPIIFTSDNPAVATIINNNVHMIGVGTANITATIAGTSSYSGVVQTTALNVVKATPVISFIAGLNAKSFTTSDFAPASSNPVLPIIYTIDNPAVATIINNNVHLVGVGTVNITATIAGSDLYNGITQTTALNITQATPIISFIAGLDNKAFSTSDFVAASSNPVVPIIFTSDNPAVATIINNNVHMIGVGTANITATITGTPLYSGLTQTTTLNVVQAAPIISFIAGLNAKPFTSVDFVAATSNPAVPIILTSDNQAVATIINNNVHLIGAGTVNITATIAGTSSYPGTTSSTPLTVIKGTPVISFIAGINAKPYTSVSFAPATSNPALPLTFTSDNPAVATIINNTVYLIGLGTANIKATIDGSNNVLYNGTSATTALNVVAATPIISFIAGLNAKPFTATDFAPATANPAVPMIFTSDNPAVATIINNNVHLIGLGTANITATAVASALYNGINATVPLTVVKAQPIISFIAGLNAKPYTTTDFVPASSNPSAPITYSSDNPAVATIVNNLVHIVGLGTANITANIDPAALYEGANASTPLVVTQANPIISFIAGLNAKPFTTANFIPATTNPAVPVTFTSDNSAVATIINNQVHVVGLGTANITATIDGSTSNGLYSSVTATSPLTVIKATPVISFIAGLNAKPYTSSNFTPATANPVLPIVFASDNPAVATIVNNLVHIVALGTANITATIDGSNSNGLYDSATATTALTVTKATPIISFIAGLNAKPFTTTDFIPATSNPALPIVFTSDNLAVAAIVNNQVHLIGLGTANITAAVDGSSTTLYESTSSSFPMTILKAIPVINFISGLSPKPYGTADFIPATSTPAVPITFQSSDLTVATIVNGKVHIVGLGSTTITATITDNSQYSGATASTTLAVSQGTPVITFANNLSPRFYGSGNFIPATATLSAPITYTLSNNNVISITNGIAQIIGIGTVTITATTPNNSVYAGATAITTITINQATPVISFIAGLNPKPYTAINFTAATATYSAPITFTSDNTAVATIVNNQVHLVGLGTANITATTPNNTFYVGQTLTAPLVVTQSTPVITVVANFSPRDYGTANFTPATATFGAPITLTTDNVAVATIVNGQVHIVAPGTANITATTPNNTLFNGATVTTPLTVNKATATVNFAALPTKIFGDTPTGIILTATTTNSTIPITYSSDNTNVATIDGSGTLFITGAGSANITASQVGNSFYNTASVANNFTVNKAAQTINFGALPASNFGDADFNLTAAATSAATVTYTSSDPTVATISGNTVHITGAGAAIITALQVGNNNYNAANTVQQTLTVNKATQTIAFNTLPAKAFGDGNFNLTATASSGLGITYASSNTNVATVSGNTITVVGVGTTNITASQTGNNNYNAATDVQQLLTVNKAVQTIAFGPLPVYSFGDPNFGLTATASSLLPVEYSSSNTAVASVIGNTITIVGVGTTTITASQNGNDNYGAATPVQQLLNVSKANQTITFNTLPAKAFGDADSNISATASSNLGVNFTSSDNNIITISGNTLHIIGAGSATIMASQAGDNNYNAAADIAQTLTIVKATQTISFNTLPAKNVGDANFNLTATASSGLAVSYTSSNNSVVTISGNTITIAGAGTATITASQTGGDNYSAATPVQQILNVNKVAQTITFNTLPTKLLGDANFDLSASATSGLAISYVSSNPAVATITGRTVTIIGGGLTSITASQAGDATYGAAEAVTRTLTVGKQTQTITFTTLPTKILGDADFNLSGTSSNAAIPLTYVSGNTSVATIINGTVHIVGAGTATITASQAGNINYNAAADVLQTLTVGKQSQTISFAPLTTQTYGSADFALSATASSGLAVTYTSSNTSIATISGNTVHIAGAGSTTITTVQNGNNNYSAATSTATVLTITKATRSITFNALPGKAYGDADFDGGASTTNKDAITYSSDNAAVATVVNGKLHITGAGSAIITASLPENANYFSSASVSQQLTVNKAAQTINFSAIPTLHRGAIYDLSIVRASSGLPVTFASSDPTIAVINGQTISALRIGKVNIMASQAGDANYNAASTAMQSADIQDADGKEIVVHQAVSPNGDGINDVLFIEGITEHPDNRITLINRNGVRIYEVNGYDNQSRAFDGHSNITGARMLAGTYFYLVEYAVNGVGRHLTGYFVLKY